ncbi:hypothetical protein [Acidisoma cladoniae]|jgi:hypothetical protein|uniref:hypothetical protein n=1 Tax=Acidisoma cladoniae TaxID=3040935 RepID=UPI002551A9A1|nr:hypothetical protein [Acidisoma sp. PAMC 29798]
MFTKTTTERTTPANTTQPKVAFLANFRRAPKVEADVKDADRMDDTAFLDSASGFESFGRGGLQLDGLHRDVQWVGAWGGRC